MGEKAAGDTGQKGAQRKGDDLDFGGVDADGLGQHLILADGDQLPPQARSRGPPDKPQGQQRQR